MRIESMSVISNEIRIKLIFLKQQEKLYYEQCSNAQTVIYTNKKNQMPQFNFIEGYIYFE